jgi:hypothetical protein
MPFLQETTQLPGLEQEESLSSKSQLQANWHQLEVCTKEGKNEKCN